MLAACLLCVLLHGSHAFLFQHNTIPSARSASLVGSLCPPRRIRARASLYCLQATAVSETAVGCAQAAETVLKLIKDTDMGANATALPLDKRQALYANLNALEASATAAGETDLFAAGGDAIGLWSVDFVGEAEAANEVRQQKSSAAGGYWRGEMGRKIFRTEGLYQHVLAFKGEDVPPYAKLGLQDAVRRREATIDLMEEVAFMKEGEWDGFGPSPAVLAEARGALNLTKVGIGIREDAASQPVEFVAVNLVRVLLFNVLPISIVLVGLATRMDTENRAAVRRKAMESGRAARMQGANPGVLNAQLPDLTSNLVRVDFAPPIIAAGPAWLQRLLKLSVGPATDVFLDTTFANSNVRLGRGATSGSRFVFQKVTEENTAAATSWSSLVEKSAPPALPLRFVGVALQWAVLARILATAASFYLSDPVTTRVLCHGKREQACVVCMCVC